MTTAAKRFVSRKLAELNEGKGSREIKDLDEELQKTHGEGINIRAFKSEEVRTRIKVYYFLFVLFDVIVL